jgi:hypothetical protein
MNSKKILFFIINYLIIFSTIIVPFNLLFFFGKFLVLKICIFLGFILLSIFLLMKNTEGFESIK